MTSIQEIISKQKEQEEKARDNELNEIKKEIDKIKRENQQQTKNSNIEKQNNIETIKKLQEKDTLKQMSDLKTLNLNLETNLHCLLAMFFQYPILFVAVSLGI